MTDRDMSYELDGIFSTRNQGQLISSTPVATKVTRTPGLAPVKIRPQYRPIKGSIEGMGRSIGEYVEAPSYSGGSLVDTALRGLGTQVNLPVVGAVSVGTLAVVGLGIWFITRK